MKISRRNLLVSPLLFSIYNLLDIDYAHANSSSGEGHSSNGWLVHSSLESHVIEGTAVSASLTGGMPLNVLSSVIRRWNYEIDTLKKDSVRSFTGVYDLPTGYSDNFSSGTAIYINERKYPIGSQDVFSLLK